MRRDVEERRARFVEAMAAQPAGERGAGPGAAIVAGFAARSAHVTASQLLSDPNILAAIDAKRQAIAERADISRADVLRMLKANAAADRAEIVEVHNHCCRYCWGIGHDYQETPRERRYREKEYEAAKAQILLHATSGQAIAHMPQFDERGGIGFTKRRNPNPECPECFGYGDTSFRLADTRTLSPAARAIYEGVEIKADGGIKVKITDRVKSQELLGRHLGMFADKHVHMNPDGTPLQIGPVQPVFVAVGVKVET